MDKAAAILKSGELAVIPTDTVYGIAASAGNANAVSRIFQVKDRSNDKPIPVLVHSLQVARELGDLDKDAEDLAVSAWPGAVTIVVPRTDGSRSLELGGNGRTIALRVPDSDFTLKLLERAGPLAATSANISGQGTPETIGSIERLFGDQVALYVDGGELSGAPSEVISFVGARRKLR